MASRLSGYISRQRLKVGVYIQSLRNRVSSMRISTLLRSRRFLLTAYVLVMVGLAGVWWWNSPYRLLGNQLPLNLPDSPPQTGQSENPEEPPAQETQVPKTEVEAEAELPPVEEEEPALPVLILQKPVDKIKMPIEGPILAAYGFKWSDTYQDFRFHNGVGIGTTQGTPVAAAYPGRVLAIVEKDPEWGCLVTIEHGSGWQSIYANLARVSVKVGQSVTEGQSIGQVGPNPPAKSGQQPQLYFALYLGEDSVDPTHMFK